MDEYIGLFERKVGELKKEGIVLPDVVLAMQLLDSSVLEQKDKQLVLTAVDYSKNNEMYAQMQRSLRKFPGEQVMPCKGVSSGLQIGIDDVQIKEESVNAACNDQRFYSRGRRNFSRRANFSRNYGSNSWMAASGGRGRGVNQNRMNPVDSQGKLMKCLVCESIMHFKRDCPHVLKNKKDSVLQVTDIEEDVDKVYDYSQENKQQPIQGAANMAILDSACTKTVTGCMWRDIYPESLSKEERNKIKHYPGGTSCKFGGETKIRSIEKLEITCNIAGKKTTILVDVVDSDIPLLLSKRDKQRLGFRLNMENDTLDVDGRVIKLDTTSSGHYYLPVNNCEIEVHNNVHLAIEKNHLARKRR